MPSARSWSSLLVFALAACGPTAEDPALSVSSAQSSFDGRVDRAVLRVRAWDVGGSPAEGLVRLSAPVGQFIGGDTVVLAEGFATATYACDPGEEPACSGSVRLAAEWNGLHASTQVTIVAPAAAVPVRWEVVPTYAIDTLEAVASAPDGTAWAVGERGTVLKLVGRAWQRVPSPVKVTLRALAFDAHGAPVIVGDQGTLLHWSRGSLKHVPLDTSVDLTAVAVDGEDVVLVGDREGVLSRLETETLVPELALGTTVLTLVRQGAEVWAGADFRLARRAAGTWLNLPMPVGARITAAQGGDTLWLGGERPGVNGLGGVLVTGPSPTWRTTPLADPVRALAVVPGSTERFALTGGRVYQQLGAGAWEPLTLPCEASAMTSRGPSDLVLVGPPGISVLRAP